MRSWNLFQGNSIPPQRRSFLDEMIALATADQPDVLCVQEVPASALPRFTVGDLASRPPFGVTVGRAVTSLHHGLIRGAVAGQGLGIWLAPSARLVHRQTLVLNSRSYRREQARALGLAASARSTWAKERRIAQVVRLEVAGRPVVVANVHCTGCGSDTRVPDAELTLAAEFTLSVAKPDDVVVLAGDFNIGPARSQVLSRLALPECGFSPARPGIDHVLVRGAAVGHPHAWPEVRRRAPGGGLLSDHAPVDLEIDL